MQTVVSIQGRRIALDCAEAERRRFEDLALALEARLSGFADEPDATRRLILTALALLDETQATSAALARARCEIERLADMLVEARLAVETTADKIEQARGGAAGRITESAA